MTTKAWKDLMLKVHPDNWTKLMDKHNDYLLLNNKCQQLQHGLDN